MVGGIERYVLDLATVQARHGLPVSVVTLDRDVLGVHHESLSEREELAGVRVVRLPGLGNQRFGLCLRPDRLAREIRRADVVHLHDLRFMVGFTCLSARATDRPLIFHTHGLLLHTSFASGLKRILMRTYYGPMLRLGRAEVVASSEHDRVMLLRDVPSLAPRTRTLLNAVDLQNYRSIVRQPIRGRILVFGRVAERKGIDRLLRALARLPRGDAALDWTLEIAGTEEASERERLDRLVASTGLGPRVRFLGEYSDDAQRDLLASATIAIFPSRAEGFGLALLEAMAAGVPILASDIAAHRALVGPDFADLIVDFDDPAATAGAIERLLRRSGDALDTLGSALQLGTEPFEIERLWSQVETVYREVGVRM